MDECQLCGGPLGILGLLGNRVQLQCRDCGMSFSREVEPGEREEIQAALAGQDAE